MSVWGGADPDYGPGWTIPQPIHHVLVHVGSQLPKPPIWVQIAQPTQFTFESDGGGKHMKIVLKWIKNGPGRHLCWPARHRLALHRWPVLKPFSDGLNLRLRRSYFGRNPRLRRGYQTPRPRRGV